MPRSIVRVKVHCTLLGWEVADGMRIFLFDSWIEAQAKADSIARRWRSHFSGWR